MDVYIKERGRAEVLVFSGSAKNCEEYAAEYQKQVPDVAIRFDDEVFKELVDMDNDTNKEALDG